MRQTSYPLAFLPSQFNQPFHSWMREWLSTSFRGHQGPYSPYEKLKNKSNDGDSNFLVIFSSSYWERRGDSLLLATISGDIWNVLNMQHITQIRKGAIIQTFPVVATKRLKNPPTWLKVAFTLKKPTTPTHIPSHFSDTDISRFDLGNPSSRSRMRWRPKSYINWHPFHDMSIASPTPLTYGFVKKIYLKIQGQGHS